MEVIYDIAVGLVSSAIYFILGVIAHKLYIMFIERNQRTLWKMFDSRNALAVRLTIRQGPLPTSTPRTSMAEVAALAELLPTFKQLGLKYELVTDGAESILKHYRNILTIGGPNANELTAALVHTYKNVWPVKILTDPVGFEVGNKTYAPVYTESHDTILSDYALLACIRENESDSSAKAYMMVMGCRGYGTRGAIASIHSKELISLYRKYGLPKSFVAIIKTDISHDELRTHVEEFFPLRMEKNTHT